MHLLHICCKFLAQSYCIAQNLFPGTSVDACKAMQQVSNSVDSFIIVILQSMPTIH